MKRVDGVRHPRAMRNTWQRFALILLVLPLLHACGFRLRGEVVLPPQLADTYIMSKDPYSGIAKALRAQLEAAGGNVVQDRRQASAVLTIIRERAENRVLSVGSTGKATEYELFDEVDFSLSDPKGKVLVEKQNVRMTRDLVFNQDELLGKLSEAESIHRQMRESLARQILLRIVAGLRSQ